MKSSVTEKPRLRPRLGTQQELLWHWIRGRKSQWTCPDASAALWLSPRLATRYVRRLVAAGYIEKVSPACRDSDGQYIAAIYRLAIDAGHLSPALIGGTGNVSGGVRDLNSDMTGAELRSIREKLQMSHSAFAKLLGRTDYRTARGYENLPLVPKPIAEKIRQIIYSVNWR